MKFSITMALGSLLATQASAESFVLFNGHACGGLQIETLQPPTSEFGCMTIPVSGETVLSAQIQSNVGTGCVITFYSDNCDTIQAIEDDSKYPEGMV